MSAFSVSGLPSYPLDIAAVGSRPSQAQPDHVHQQAGYPQQVHGIPDERRGNDVVDKERSVIRQEDAPEGDTGPPLSIIDSLLITKGKLSYFKIRVHKNATYQ